MADDCFQIRLPLHNSVLSGRGARRVPVFGRGVPYDPARARDGLGRVHQQYVW